MLEQKLEFKLSQKLSPQQIQLMKLIQLNTLSFEQRLDRELEENPALANGKENTSEQDEDHPDDGSQIIETEDINIDEYLSDDEIPEYRLRSNNYNTDDENKHIPYAAGISFHQQLMTQLDTFSLSDQDYKIASFLVGSIDDSGYIRREIMDVVDDLAFTENIFVSKEKVEEMLKIVHKLDPAGVGALNLKQCLLLQLKRKKQTPTVELSIKVLSHAFDAFSKKHYKNILSKFSITDQQLKDSISEIEKLNPKPGGSYASSTKINSHIVPDFSIQIIDGELVLQLNNRNAPQLHISGAYKDMLSTYKDSKIKSKDQQEAVQFIKQKLDGAKWFIDAIQQRNHTLMVTMEHIMNFQKEYFLTGNEQKLKPMILKDIAQRIQMDISTVSRVANSKYVETPYGTKLLKSFFSEGISTTSGEEVSSIEVRKSLELLIEEENKKKPYTDDQLAQLLRDKGYKLARRTVAKYREGIGAPVARLRKQL